jgi:C1A family cysteine protease
MKKLTKNKFRDRILNCVPSPKRDLDFTAEDAVIATAKKKSKETKIPASKDLRSATWKIGDQGATGSCVGWATADGVLLWQLTKAGRIASNEKLSVRFQWMASKETDIFNSKATTFIDSAGTSLKAALDVARKYGCVKEAVLPFNGKLSPLDENAFYALAANLKIGAYFSLTGANKLTNMRNWIANNGPILVRLDCDTAWFNVGSNGLLETYVQPSQPAGHAVAIVGYTPTHFIVRNSWGTGWGHNGFAYASNAYTNAAFTEAYGISV